MPIITFVNELDREGRDPFDLLDEIEQSLVLDVTPASWPIGMGRDFLGAYDLSADTLPLFERGVHDVASGWRLPDMITSASNRSRPCGLGPLRRVSPPDVRVRSRASG
jgi:peptide subunit release factor RF-3